MPVDFEVVIQGAGIAGLGMAIQYRTPGTTPPLRGQLLPALGKQ
jgi:hypothetical protein